MIVEFSDGAQQVVCNVHDFGHQNLRHTYTNCTLGPLLPTSLPLAGVFEVGSKQTFFTNEYITLQYSSIDMGNADFGVALGDFDGTATHQSLYCKVSSVCIDGTNSKPGAAGIAVSDFAQFTTLAANRISNCPVAIDRTSNPSDLTIRNNVGTCNAVGITSGSGANNILIDNFLTYECQEGAVVCCPGDLTGDGAIDHLDLIELLACLGLPANPPCDTGQDINFDGTVNLLDLIDLLLAFGTTCP